MSLIINNEFEDMETLEDVSRNFFCCDNSNCI